MLVAGAKQRNYEVLPLGMDSDEEVTAGVADAHLVTDERMNRWKINSDSLCQVYLASHALVKIFYITVLMTSTLINHLVEKKH